VIDDWANALRTKDADGVISHQTSDLVQFALAPPLQATALDRKSLEEWLSSWRGPIEYEIREQSINASDTLAFCHSLNRMSATNSDGQKTDMWFRQTMCFRKLGGEWKITHRTPCPSTWTKTPERLGI
jgi:ketosteroid isomerase-like protein